MDFLLVCFAVSGGFVLTRPGPKPPPIAIIQLRRADRERYNVAAHPPPRGGGGKTHKPKNPHPPPHPPPPPPPPNFEK